MTGPISRRDALLRTAALASASVLPALCPAFAAPPSLTRGRGNDLDKSLHAAVSAHEIPGAVAMAANGDSILYEGAIGSRGAGADAHMSPDTIFRLASLVKLLTS